MKSFNTWLVLQGVLCPLCMRDTPVTCCTTGLGLSLKLCVLCPEALHVIVSLLMACGYVVV